MDERVDLSFVPWCGARHEEAAKITARWDVPKEFMSERMAVFGTDTIETRVMFRTLLANPR
jgi:hypothetical protein